MKQPAKVQALLEIIAPAVAVCGVDLWGIELLQQGRRSLLRIYIDKPLVAAPDTPEPDVDDDNAGRGVDVNDCVRVTHQVNGVLDVHDPIAGEYALEVSSPGWDRPFFSLEQMQAYVGQTVALRLIAPVDNRRKMTGVLQELTAQGLTIVVDGKALEIDGDNLDKANLVYQDE
jgi:ribosome maturation factor RimP